MPEQIVADSWTLTSWNLTLDTALFVACSGFPRVLVCVRVLKESAALRFKTWISNRPLVVVVDTAFLFCLLFSRFFHFSFSTSICFFHHLNLIRSFLRHTHKYFIWYIYLVAHARSSEPAYLSLYCNPFAAATSSSLKNLLILEFCQLRVVACLLFFISLQLHWPPLHVLHPIVYDHLHHQVYN